HDTGAAHIAHWATLAAQGSIGQIRSDGSDPTAFGLWRPVGSSCPHSTGIPPGASSETVMSGSPAQCGANCVGIPNQLTQCSRIDTGSSWGHKTESGSG